MSDFEKQHWDTLNKREQYLLTEVAGLLGPKSLKGKVLMEALAMCLVKERRKKRKAMRDVRDLRKALDAYAKAIAEGAAFALSVAEYGACGLPDEFPDLSKPRPPRSKAERDAIVAYELSVDDMGNPIK